MWEDFFDFPINLYENIGGKIMAKEKKEKVKKPIYKRIWFWIILVIIVGAIASGSGNSDSKGKKDVKVSGEKTEEIKVEKQVVYEEKDIKVTVVGYETDGLFGDSLKVQIENNSSKNIGITTNDTVAINGIMVGDLFAADVAAGKKTNDEITFLSSDLKAAGIETVKDIEFKLHVYDGDSYDTIDDSDLITVTTNVDKDFKQKIDESGSLAVDEKGVKVYVKKVESEDSFWGADVYLLVENNTGKDISVYVEDVSVNGFMVDPIYASSIRKDRVAFDSITFLDSDLEDNGIKTIENIEMSFKVINNKGYSTILKTKPVKIDIK